MDKFVDGNIALAVPTGVRTLIATLDTNFNGNNLILKELDVAGNIGSGNIGLITIDIVCNDFIYESINIITYNRGRRIFLPEIKINGNNKILIYATQNLAATLDISISIEGNIVPISQTA